MTTSAWALKTSALTLGQFDVAAVAVFYALHLGILFAVLAPLEHPPRLLALVIASAMAIGAVLAYPWSRARALLLGL